MLTDCIEWQGGKHRQGYGSVRFRGKTWLAHRVAWVKERGEIPEGMCVLHKCDNPVCVNTDHLFLGTQQDNIKDCFDKGRISHAPRNTGKNHWKSKVDAAVVREIRALKGAEPLRVTGERFGISKQAVWDIQAGRNWKHI